MKATITIKKNDTNEYEILVNGESYDNAPICSSEQQAAETIYTLWGAGMNVFQLEEINDGIWEITLNKEEMMDKIEEMNNVNNHLITNDGKKFIMGTARIAYLGHNIFGSVVNGYVADIYDYTGKVVGSATWKENVNWDCEDEGDACDWYSPDVVEIDDTEVADYKVV